MDQLAAWLCARSVGEGHVVAIYGHRHASLVSAVAGVLATGAAYLLLDPSYPPGRLAQYLRTSRPKAWVALDAAGPPDDQLLGVLDELGVEVRTRVDISGELGHDPPGPVTPRPELLQDVTARIGPDSFACLTFTSGSTGDPKAVMGRHGSLTHFLPWQTERFAVTDRDRFSMLSGLAHDPIQRDMFWPLWVGATVVVPDPEQMADARISGCLAPRRAHQRDPPHAGDGSAHHRARRRGPRRRPNPRRSPAGPVHRRRTHPQRRRPLP